MRAINDDIDDDGEYLTFSFGTLPELVYAGDQATVRASTWSTTTIPRCRCSSNRPTTR